MKGQEIINRLRSANGNLEDFRRKIWRLRRIVAGDSNAIEDGSYPDITDKVSPNLSLPNILVTNIEEGISNNMLQSIKTLALQTAFRIPEVSFPDLSSEREVVNAEYIYSRTREEPFGCNAVQEVRLATLDYMCGGMGFVHICMRNGLPIIEWSDTLNMYWDQLAISPSKMKWVALNVNQRITTWSNLYPNSQAIARAASKETPDGIITLTFYYDVEGKAGNYAVLVRTSENTWDDEPVVSGSNPCYYEVEGERIPFIPFESVFFFSLPSVTLPVGAAELMLPAQIATWRVEETIKKIVDRGAPFYEVNNEGLKDGELERFEEGEIGSIVQKKDMNPAFIQQPAMEIPTVLLQWKSLHDQELISMGGANPYSAGAPVPGTEFASEVSAIQMNAGLVAGAIARDVAGLYERTFRKFLALGSIYDLKPLVVPYEDVQLTFNDSDPVRRYLVPLAQLAVKEDSFRFKSKAQVIAEAFADVNLAIQLQQRYPKMLDKAIANYLKAKGEKNPQAWMEQPDQPQITPEMLAQLNGQQQGSPPKQNNLMPNPDRMLANMAGQ